GAAFRHSFDRIAQPDYAVQASLPGKHPLVVVNEEPRRDERACRLHSPFVGDSCGYRMRCARADVSLVENLWAPRAQVNSGGKCRRESVSHGMSQRIDAEPGARQTTHATHAATFDARARHRYNQLKQ